jgi:hypothetical protein
MWNAGHRNQHNIMNKECEIRGGAAVDISQMGRPTINASVTVVRKGLIRLLMALIGSFAVSTCFADTWVQNLTPLQVITSTDASGQYIQLIVSQTVSNPASCLNGDSYISRTLPSSTLAMILSAIGMGKSVRIYLASGSCDSLLLRPTFKDVGIQ